MGRRRKRFGAQDIERMLAHIRKLESARLGMSGQSKAQLAGLLSRLDADVTYESRMRKREEEKRQKEAERLERKRKPRVRLPRRPRPPIEGID
jgi:hypothetical protein